MRDGRHIAAFALSEPEAGSDVSALAATATKDGPAHMRIDGLKTWISNGGIADHYVVFARTGEAPGAKGLSAFIVDADTPGLEIAGRIEVIAPHPLATLRFTGCRVPLANRLGGPGEGFKVAMATLDIFRSTVAAAALGLARRAFDEMIERAATRNLFGAPLADCSSRRPRWRTAPSTSMPRPCWFIARPGQRIAVRRASRARRRWRRPLRPRWRNA